MKPQMGNVKPELISQYMKAKTSKEKLDLLLKEVKDDKSLEVSFKTWKLTDIIGLLLQRNFTLIDIKELLETRPQPPDVKIPDYFYWQPLDRGNDIEQLVNPPQDT